MLELRPILDIPPGEQARILWMRNQEPVRRNMYSDHIITEDEHQAWLEQLRTSDDTKFFAVYVDGFLGGGVSLNAINRTHKRADWAFYLGATIQGSGMGSALEFKFLDYAFNDEGLEKLNCEVLAFNAAVVRLHKKFGFVEEGVRRNHILRDGEPVDAVLLGITKEEWAARRPNLEKVIMRNWTHPFRRLDPAEVGNVFA